MGVLVSNPGIHCAVNSLVSAVYNWLKMAKPLASLIQNYLIKPYIVIL
ncbi:hypothetical protein JN11_04299 [Mucilaginibacter frigoritolerans]|jgi:hypothetical protein|uniref:Uncharacterized protein n=1 Tax=Mucilaginibacter frigoritolerans TaxID=652788 RepID=A0A562TRZ9_9SPHI|nr:hypothetical protein JN11_04299 [Mucilaginibacter frigoritolerans]